MTLLEVMIVLAILILMMGLAVGSFGSLKSTELRTQTNKIAAAMRHTFNRSVATGLYMRMVFDIDGDSYWVEASDTPQFLAKEKRKEGDDPEEEQRIKEEEEREKRPDDAPPLPTRKRYQQDGVIPKVSLKKGIKIDGVITTGQDGVFSGGRAFVHFFPNGFVEPSMVYTSDGEDSFFTLTLNPLTGRVKRTRGKVDPDRHFGEPENVEDESR